MHTNFGGGNAAVEEIGDESGRGTRPMVGSDIHAELSGSFAQNYFLKKTWFVLRGNRTFILVGCI
jgi:hypothetical protein